MANRYNTIPQTRIEGKRVYQNVKYPDIPLSENDIYVQSSQGDRFDILAQQYYNDSSLWWVISSANNDLPQDSLVIPLQQQIRIPANVGNIVNNLWFQEFNWCFSNGKYLIISGKTADQNEIIVKKYMNNKKDIYMHADFPGSGSCIVIGGQELIDDTSLFIKVLFLYFFLNRNCSLNYTFFVITIIDIYTPYVILFIQNKISN